MSMTNYDNTADLRGRAIRKAEKEARKNPRLEAFKKMTSAQQEQALKEDEERIGIHGDQPKMQPGEAVVTSGRFVSDL